MESETKEKTFERLQREIENNSKSILLYKKWSPVLMLLFVGIAFLMFYFNLKETFINVQALFNGVLVLIFLTLTIFHFTILKKTKKNKNLDTKIYNLLKL